MTTRPETTSMEPCPRCDGVGLTGHPDDPAARCPRCEGSGGIPMPTSEDATRRRLEQDAAAYREMAPYLDRLQSLSQRLGWPLGRLLIKSAVEQLEQDYPRHVH